MKIKYDIKNNHYKMYGEANYLVMHKKKYLNNFNKKIRNYFDLFYIITAILYLFSILIEIDIISKFLFILSTILLFYIFMAYQAYIVYKNSNHKGEIIIDEYGITDKSDIIVSFPWDKIELIGITKNTLAIVTNSPMVLILEPNEKIIEEIKKYKDIKVIRSI